MIEPKPSITLTGEQMHEVAMCCMVAKAIIFANNESKKAKSFAEMLASSEHVSNAMLLTEHINGDIMNALNPLLEPYLTCDDPKCLRCRADDYANKAKS